MEDLIEAKDDRSNDKMSSIEYNEQDMNEIKVNDSTFSIDPSFLDEKSEESKHIDIVQDDLDKMFRLVTDSHLKHLAYELGIIRLCWPSCSGDDESLKILPFSYKNNTAKEKLVLFYAENFRRQFCQLHPSRKPLLLAIDNEGFIQKFVSTTIRPTKITYPEFYTWQGCASFVADHITYSPMPKDKPTGLPSILMSPDTVMKEQKGSCFEMSTLLVSFLIGSGYDAYVVSGYATREICANDLSRYKCPLLNEEPQEEEPIVEVLESKYVAKPVRDLRSKFLLMMEEREEARQKAEVEKELEEERLRILELEKPDPDPLFGWRVHSWALVLPGKRDIKAPFFIESASGMSYDVSDPNYLGIESIWNNFNYWVNLQMCHNGCEELDWDLTKNKKWEHLLVGEPWDQRVVKDSFTVKDDSDSVLEEKHLDMPMSWVNQIELPNDRYEQRYPNGSKSINYYKAMCDLYAPYLHRDGLVWRIITYCDYEQINPEVIHECYKYREDCLQKKVRYLATDETYEFYKRGRDDCIKTFKSYITDEFQQHLRREIDFYHEARYDGLSRLEMSSEHMLEEFKGRDDCLFRRYVSVKTSERRSVEDGDRRTYKYVKEEYERNPSIPADEDIASREFCVQQNQIVLKYHYGPDKVTAAFRRINKPPISDLGDRLTYDESFFVVYKPDPFAEPDRKVDLYLLMVKSLQDEEMTLCHIRGMEDELYNMIHTRSLEAAQANLIVSIFDELRNEDAKLGMKEMERAIQEKVEREVEAGIDFLAPYLIGREKDEVLPYDLALKVREKCLENYKQTLVNRANRMKLNFEELSMRLSEEDLQSKSSSDSEDQVQYHSVRQKRSDIVFLLHILEKRLQRHKETAVRRYKAVEECLKYDKRLSAIYPNKL